jgi:hypothetical protein
LQGWTFGTKKNLYDTEYKMFDDSLKRLYKFLLQNRIRHERYYSDLFVGSNVYSGVKYVFNINIPNDVHKLYWSEVYRFQIYDVLKGENYRCFISFRYYSWGYINFTR